MWITSAPRAPRGRESGVPASEQSLSVPVTGLVLPGGKQPLPSAAIKGKWRGRGYLSSGAGTQGPGSPAILSQCWTGPPAHSATCSAASSPGLLASDALSAPQSGKWSQVCETEGIPEGENLTSMMQSVLQGLRKQHRPHSGWRACFYSAENI